MRTGEDIRAIALRPERYHVFGSEDFGAPGLVARESVGPATDVIAVGPIVTIHDSTFEPRSGIGHHPHRGMERLFYILEGAVDHDDSLNGIRGHMGTGDLGILTEGARGMLHSEWNHTDGRARCYIFVYPTDPTPARAAFDAVRDADAPREQAAPGVVAKRVVTREANPLHGDLRELSDLSLEGGATLALALGPDEAAVAFVVDGLVVAEGYELAREHTLVIPPGPATRVLGLAARDASRLIVALTGPGFGLRTR